MQNVMDFLSAALPWLCVGLLLAVFFVRADRAKKKSAEKEEKGEKKKPNYGTEGMALGMCFGTAIGTSFGKNTGLGMALGMLIGLAVGSSLEKKEDGKDK